MSPPTHFLEKSRYLLPCGNRVPRTHWGGSPASVVGSATTASLYCFTHIPTSNNSIGPYSLHAQAGLGTPRLFVSCHPINGEGATGRHPPPPSAPSLLLSSLAKSTSKNVSTSSTAAASTGGTALCTGELRGSGEKGSRWLSSTPDTHSSSGEGGTCGRSCPVVTVADNPRSADRSCKGAQIRALSFTSCEAKAK